MRDADKPRVEATLVGCVVGMAHDLKISPEELARLFTPKRIRECWPIVNDPKRPTQRTPESNR